MCSSPWLRFNASSNLRRSRTGRNAAIATCPLDDRFDARLDADRWANIFIFAMPTTVHIPALLLKRVDQRAKALGVSRNRLIIQAVEAKLGTRRAWPPELIASLGQPLDAETARALDGSLSAVRKRRSNRKRFPKF